MRLLLETALLTCMLALSSVSALAAAPLFAPVMPLPAGRSLHMPQDGGAHPDYKTEWWYATGWLNTSDGKTIGYQVTFFRSATSTDRSNPSAFAPQQLIIGHAALSDPAVGKLLHEQKIARQGFGLAYAKVGELDLKLEDWRMVRAGDGQYQVTLATPEFCFNLRLAPSGPLLLQGERGYSRKGPKPDQASYYYSEPQLKTTGSITRAGKKAQNVTGVTWLDHEWSSQALDPNASGWDWVGANLDDGGALMAFQIRDKTGKKLWAHATLRDASGKITQYLPQELTFTPQTQWRSPRTNVLYPVATLLTLGRSNWRITPLQNDQELDAQRTSGALYWEGAAYISRDGVPAGRAYLEMTGYGKPMQL